MNAPSILAGRKLTIADLRARPEPAPAAPTPPPPEQPAISPLPAPVPELPPVLSARARKAARRLAKHGLTLQDANRLVFQLIERYSAAFDPSSRPPLAIGVYKTIRTDLDCHPALLNHVLGGWCSHPFYLKNIAHLSQRVHLDGTPATEVTAEEKAAAAHHRAVLFGNALSNRPAPSSNRPAPFSRARNPTMPIVTAKALKATLVLDPISVLNIAVPEGGASRTMLNVRLPDRTLTVDLASKAIRKAQAVIDECGVEAIAVLLQGRLAAGDVLVECGIVAQPKGKKPDASTVVASAPVAA